MTILCYHTVDPEWGSPLSVAPDTFADHCRWLANNRQVVDLPRAIELIGPDGRLPRGVSVMTFDDGFASLHEHAWPILREHRLPATVFLVAETLTPLGRVVDWVDPQPAVPPETLSREQVLEMREDGIRFESHSFSHRVLTELDEVSCLRDLRLSREVLEDLLDQPIRYLAYPKGRHDPMVRRAAELAGYSHAFALPESPEPRGPFSLPRAGVYPHNGVGALRTKTTRWYPSLRTSRAFPLLRQVAQRA
jgi:peptidoglycan/xylan/chitin deacetylase (PgdA/CDA1 family)